jgi:hypothetical protein
VSYPDAAAGRHAASPTLSAARARLADRSPSGPRFPRHRRPMSPELRQQVTDGFAKGEFCTMCGDIHAGLGSPACPRVAACELDADGKIRYVEFWPAGEYDTSGCYSAADAEADDEPAVR